MRIACKNDNDDDEKSNNDEGDTRLKRLSGYSNCLLYSIVVFLHSCSSIYIFTDSLFLFCAYSLPLAFVFIEPFLNVFREVRSLKWPVTIKNFALGL